jgi:hypothetical protein
VLAGRQRHGTIDRALRFLGLGSAAIVPVDADDQGRMRTEALRSALGQGSGPTIVCAQVGNVNSGAVDPVGELCEIAHQAGSWVHVDGAFGLWAAASPRLRHLVAGVERADSWATDAHKWLNVPYDSGLVLCAHPEAHRAAMGVRASYLVHGSEGERDALDYNPEFSRRTRGFAVYAAIRGLGRAGIAGLVERCCTLARRFAGRLDACEDVEVLNDVVLNQVLVRFLAADGDHDGHTRRVVERVQQDGTCWMSGTTWQGRAGHADLGVELDDRRGRRRPVGGGNPPLCPTGRHGSGDRAGAGAVVAAGAAVGVAGGGALQVDAGDVGDADQPREGVAQLVLERGRVGGAERLGDLADLLDPPAEGAVDPAGAVACPEGRLDPVLQVGQVHGGHLDDGDPGYDAACRLVIPHDRRPATAPGSAAGWLRPPGAGRLPGSCR